MREQLLKLARSRQIGQPGVGQPGVGQPPNQNAQLAFQQQMQLQNGMANGLAMPPQLVQGLPSTLPQQPTQMSSFQQQVNMQQSQSGLMSNVGANMPPTPNSRPQQTMPQQFHEPLTPDEERSVAQLAQSLQQSFSPAQMEAVNQRAKSLPLATAQHLRQQGVTPHQYIFRMHAARLYRTTKAKNQQQQQQQLSRQDNDLANQLSQQARQTPRNINLEQSIPAAGQNSANFDSGGNVKNSMHEMTALQQQQEAMRSQELGHQVVPASNSQPMPPPNQQQRLNMHNTPRQQHPQQTPTPNPQHQQMMIRKQQNEKIQVTRMAHKQGQTQHQPSLTGQVGGLTTNLGQSVPRQSPAMPTLNKPHDPSAQQTQGQGTPSQRQQPTPDQNAQTQRANQQPQGMNVSAPQINQAQLAAVISRLPPNVQQRLSTMPYAERVAATLMFIKQYQQKSRNSAIATGRPTGIVANNFGNNGQNRLDQQTRAMLSGQPNAGAQPTPNAPVPQMRGTNQSTMQSGQQQWGLHGTPNPQIITGMMAAQQISGESKIQQGQVPSLSAEQVRAMDMQSYPQTILGATFPTIPPEVRTWGQLKAWAIRSPDIISPEIVEKLKHLQAMHFKRIMSQRQAQMSMNPQATPVTTTMLPQAPVPTAQMVPQGAQPTMQNGNNAMLRSGQGSASVPPPTLQEVQHYRQRLPPHLAFMTDEQIFGQLWAQKYKMAQLQAQQTMNARQATMQNMQPMNISGVPGMPAPTNQQQPHQQVPIKAPTGVNPSPNAGNATPAQQLRVNQPNVIAKGVKRGSADDVVEVPNPNLLQQQNQNQNLKLGKLSQGNQQPALTQQGHDRAQYEAELRKHAVQGTPQASAKAAPGSRPSQMNHMQPGHLPQQPNPQAQPPFQPPSEEEMMQRKAHLAQLSQDVYSSLPIRNCVALDAETSRSMAILLQREFQLISKTDNAIQFYYIKMRGPEATVRELLLLRAKILAQYKDKLGTPQSLFTVNPQELQVGINRIRHFMQFTMKVATQTTLQPQVPQFSQQQAKPLLNEQNLQQNQQAEQQAFQKARQNQIERQHSNRGMRVPAAPTTSQPPFSFGAQSPNGVPNQYGNQTLTADQLHIPTNKRRKPNGPSNTGTPAEKKATPGSNASPKVTKDAIPPSVKPIPVVHKCFVANCPVSKPFPTAEALAQHKRDAHEAKEPVIEDPFAWAMESIRIGLGLDENGNPKPKEQKQQGSVEMKKSGSAQGATPIKHEVVTPSNGNLKTPQPSNSQAKSPLPIKGSALTTSKAMQPTQPTLQLPPTPPYNPWDDTPFSPQLLSSHFPSLADLHSSLALDIVTLTPASSTSRSAETSPQTDKNSPESRKSDIGDNNDLDMTIRISGDDEDGAKNKFWPEGFFNDCEYPELAPSIDEVTLRMSWEELCGESFGQEVVAMGGGKKRKENDGFDASRFKVIQ